MTRTVDASRMLSRLCLLAVTLVFAVLPNIELVASITPFFNILPVRFLWRHTVWSNNLGSHTDINACGASSSCEAVAYIPNTNHSVFGLSGAGTSGIYLFFNGYDHADYHSGTGCCGYSVQFGGNPWYYGFASGTLTPGLYKLEGAYHSGTGDRATQTSLTPIGGGYSYEFDLGGYGYPRNLRLNEVLLTTTAGGVTIDSNAVAGGSLWRWTHNGTQYINLHDYGRQIQTALHHCRWQNASTPFECYAPTEAGDTLGGQEVPAWLQHGSPIVTFADDYASPSPTQTTRAIPLETAALHPDFGGPGTQLTWFEPLLQRDLQVGKNITLNWQQLGPVARYETALYLPSSLSLGILGAPFVHANAFLTRFYTYDPFGNALTDRASDLTCNLGPPYSEETYVFASTFSSNLGGVIMASGDSTKAMGLFGAKRNATINGSTATWGVDAFQLWDSTCVGDGTGETANAAAFMFATVGHFTNPGTPARDGHVSFPAGWSSHTTWIITGTLGEVQSKMEAICTIVNGSSC